MSLDLKLTPLHDLEVSDYDLKLIDEKDQLVQNLKIRLLFFLGEWFLNVSRGIPYYEEILIKNPNQQRVESIFKEAILTTDNVRELIEFELDYDSVRRLLTVNFICDTDFGIVQLEEDLPV